jgi:hypothetical protein
MRTFMLALSLLMAPPVWAQSWVPVTPIPGTFFVAVNPGISHQVWAGTRDGLFASQDGGASWMERDRGLPPSPCYVAAAAFDRVHRHRLFVGGCGVFRSHGSGRRWRSLGIDGEGVSTLALGPGRRRGTLWAGTTGDSSDVAGKILRHRRGRRWETVFDAGDVDVDITAIVPHPVDPQIVHAATNNDGILETTDGGATWSPTNTGLPRFDFTGAPSPSGAFVLTVPLVPDRADPETLYTGTLGYGSCCLDVVGVGGDVFTTHDGGATWNPSAAGLVGVNVLALATDPVVPGTLYAGTTNGVYRSLDGAGTWAPFGLTGHLVVSLAIAEDGTALYAAEGHPRYAANGALFRTPLP